MRLTVPEPSGYTVTIHPQNNNNSGFVMADNSILRPLTGFDRFDQLIADFSDIADADEQEAARGRIWSEFGVEGAVFISDMASFSSTSRKVGVCHFLKLIHRARQLIAPLIAANNGKLLKCDADNCYAFFDRTDDAIQASFDVNAALFKSNTEFRMEEQIYLSVGIDYGRVLLIDDIDFFGDPVNTASKLGEDLAIKAETLVTKRAIEHSNFDVPELAERMTARISDIKIKYVRIPMTERSGR
jgi:class 3 adenylate cyclase